MLVAAKALRRLLLALFALAIFTPAIAQQNSPTPTGAVASVNAIATGTTGAISASLPGVAGKVTYICGFDVSGAGSATMSPITVAGLLGGTFTYQGISAGAVPFQHAYSPCVPASNVNTAITVNTTADGTATAVDVQAWGYQQ